MENKMTKKVFFEMVANGTINDDVKAFAKASLESVIKSSASKSAKSAEKRAEKNAPHLKAINDYLATCNEPQLLTKISEMTSLSVPTISGLAREQVALGRWIKGTQSVKGKGKQTILSLAPTDAEEVEEE